MWIEHIFIRPYFVKYEIKFWENNFIYFIKYEMLILWITLNVHIKAMMVIDNGVLEVMDFEYY